MYFWGIFFQILQFCDSKILEFFSNIWTAYHDEPFDIVIFIK